VPPASSGSPITPRARRRRVRARRPIGSPRWPRARSRAARSAASNDGVSRTAARKGRRVSGGAHRLAHAKGRFPDQGGRSNLDSFRDLERNTEQRQRPGFICQLRTPLNPRGRVACQRSRRGVEAPDPLRGPARTRSVARCTALFRGTDTAVRAVDAPQNPQQGGSRALGMYREPHRFTGESPAECWERNRGLGSQCVVRNPGPGQPPWTGASRRIASSPEQSVGWPVRAKRTLRGRPQREFAGGYNAKGTDHCESRGTDCVTRCSGIKRSKDNSTASP